MSWTLPWFRRRSPPVAPERPAPPAPRSPDVQSEVLVLMDNTLDPRLVVYHEPSSYPSEQYRAFRTNLRALNPGAASRSLVLTSSQPDEGKSTTVANVALSLAEDEHLKICLVDLDLRAPQMHHLFGVPRRPGITEVLMDRRNPERVLQPGGMPNLRLLTAGRPTDKPSEVVSSAYLQDLLHHLKRDYDYILIDTPPCTLFADASQIAKVVDGVIMVVSLNDTMKKDADEALDVLNAAGANVIGSFVTGTSTSSPTIVGDYGQV